MKILMTITAICLFSFPTLGEIYDYSDSEIEYIEKRVEEIRDARNFKPKNRLPNLPDLEL